MPGNDTSAQNDWKGAWWHSSFDINSGNYLSFVNVFKYYLFTYITSWIFNLERTSTLSWQKVRTVMVKQLKNGCIKLIEDPSIEWSMYMT